MPDSPDILGTFELAALAGVAPRTMSGYLARGQCPPPDYRLQCGPIWRRETAEAWIARRRTRRRCQACGALADVTFGSNGTVEAWCYEHRPARLLIGSEA